MFSIYEQVHFYISICLFTGWGSKGAATARLLPYMGGTLTYTKVMDTCICLYKSHLHTSTHIYTQHTSHTSITHIHTHKQMVKQIINLTIPYTQHHHTTIFRSSTFGQKKNEERLFEFLLSL